MRYEIICTYQEGMWILDSLSPVRFSSRIAIRHPIRFCCPRELDSIVSWVLNETLFLRMQRFNTRCSSHETLRMHGLPVCADCIVGHHSSLHRLRTRWSIHCRRCFYTSEILVLGRKHRLPFCPDVRVGELRVSKTLWSGRSTNSFRGWRSDRSRRMT